MCALNCMEKYLKMNQRISQRFQEYQMIANENAIAASEKLTSVAKWKNECSQMFEVRNNTVAIFLVVSYVL